MTIDERARQISEGAGISYDLALALALIERGEFDGDMFIIDDDGNERPAPLTPMEDDNGRDNSNRAGADSSQAGQAE